MLLNKVEKQTGQESGHWRRMAKAGTKAKRAWAGWKEWQGWAEQGREQDQAERQRREGEG
jgi:hypothetical protein